jgi:predicted transcriptional regulator
LDYQALFTAGIIDRNETRKELGFDEIEEEEAPVALSKQNPFGWDDERDLIVFNKYGEKAEEFEEARFEFADAIESAILNVLKENKGLQVGDIVNITKLDAKVVADAIAKLAKAELIKSYEDGLETTPKGLDEIKNLQTELVVRYQYGLAPGITGGLLIDTSRKFCTDVVNSGRVYSREDINMMSAELGYDVWKRRGEWYTNPTTGITTPQCRHIWVQKLLRRIKR